MTRKLWIIILLVFVSVGLILSFDEPVSATETNPTVTQISTSNWGSFEGTNLWVNCGADFNNQGIDDTVQFFLCKNEGDKIDTALLTGSIGQVDSVPSATDVAAIRAEKNENGLLINNDLDAGEYYIGCRLHSGNMNSYAYQKFTIFPTASEYVQTGLNMIIHSYQSKWFMLRGKYVGLGKETDDYGNDWEAWIFPALGSTYPVDGDEMNFDVDGPFLSSYDGATYLDQLKKTLQTIEKNGELENQGTKQLFKWIAAVTACGQDPRNFEGYNLVQLMTQYAYNEDGTPSIDQEGNLQIPAHLGISDDILFLSYELLGLEIAGATPEEGYTDDIRKAGIRKILSVYGADKVDGHSVIASDYYSMAMLPLLFFKEDETYGTACVHALNNFRSFIFDYHIGSNGAMMYGSISGSEEEVWNRSNANTESVAVNALVMQGVSSESFESETYQKQYGNLLTALCGDITDNGVLYGGQANRMATYQTLGALVDLYNGKSCFEIAAEKYRANYPEYFVEPIDLSKAAVTAPSQTYSGKALTPKVTVKLAGQTLTTADYDIVKGTYKNAGTYTITINGKGKYTGTAKGKFTVNKATQKVTAKAKTKVFKVKTVKKKAQVFKIAKTVTAKGQGKITYSAKAANAKSKKALKIKNGKITVKKKTKKGTYKVKVTVKAAGNKNYKAAAKTVTLNIRIK